MAAWCWRYLALMKLRQQLPVPSPSCDFGGHNSSLPDAVGITTVDPWTCQLRVINILLTKLAVGS